MRVSWMIIAILALAGPAFAQTLSTGGTNMTPGFYPKPKCEPAGKAPVQPGNDPDAMRVYNLKVREPGSTQHLQENRARAGWAQDH